MADPLSLIASLIAIAQISGEIVSLCYNYRSGIKGADASVARLISEVKSVRDMIENLIKLVDDQSAQDSQLEAIAFLAVKDGPLTQALEELQALQVKLKPATGWRAIGKLLKWPLTEPEVVKTLARINRFKTTLVVASSTDHLKIAIAHRSETQAVRDDTKSLLKYQNLTQDEKSREAIFRWLDVPRVEANLIMARSKRCASTGLWISIMDLWDSLVLEHLLRTGNDHLTCGSRLWEDNSKVATTYFFIDSSDHTKRTAIGFVTSLLFQLAAKSSTSLQKLKPYHGEFTTNRRDGPPSAPTMLRLLEILGAILVEYQVVYIVIDALDESSGVEEFFDVISTLKGGGHDQLRLLIASRPTRAIASAMEPLSPLAIALDTSLVQADIEKYVESSVAAIASVKKWPADLSSEVKTELTTKACGMFRWVECQLDSLRKCMKPLAVRKSLRSLPATLDETYESSVRTVSDELLDDAQILLEWIVASFRPLQLKEISEILAFDWEKSPHFHKDYRLSTPSDLLLICGDFLIAEVIEEKDSPSVRLGLAHSSVRDFLLSRHRRQSQSRLALDLGEAHTCMARISLLYLLTTADEITEVGRLRADFPLSDYAARYWIDHYHAASDKDSLALLAIKLFDKTQKHNIINWIQLFSLERLGRRRRHQARTGPAIYYASLAGLLEVLSIMLKSGESPNATGGQFGFPLQAAAAKGHLPIVKMLLEGGADPNQRGGLLGNALQAASTRGYTTVVKELLSCGANLDHSSYIGTCLYQAATYGHLEIARLLLDAGADPFIPLAPNGPPILAALKRGQESICRFFIERGPGENGSTDLYSHLASIAVGSGLLATAELLFENGAERSTLTLAKAASFGNIKLVQELLKEDIPANGTSHHRPLIEAAKSGNSEVIEQLLSAGVDVNAKDEDGATALFAAASHGHFEVVQKLLSAGVDVNAKAKIGATALFAAASHGHFEVVQKLMDNGAYYNIVSGRPEVTDLNSAASVSSIPTVGTSPTHGQPADLDSTEPAHGISRYHGLILHAACYSGNTRLVAMILDKEADVNLDGGLCELPIIAAVESHSLEVVELLLNRGALVNPSLKSSRSPLETAAERGFSSIVNMLLSHGADVHLVRESSRGPSHDRSGVPYLDVKLSAFEKAVSSSRVDCVQVFLAHGCNPDVKFPPGTSPYERYPHTIAVGLGYETFAIRQAARNGDVKMIRTLAKAGADINAKSTDGWTAVHEAARAGDFPLIMILLDEFNADPHPKLANGSEPIHLAAEQGYELCLRVLLARGVDVNVLNSRGLSPLHVAAGKGRLESVQTLLLHGADTALKAAETSLTALDVAEMLKTDTGEPRKYDWVLNRRNVDVEKTIEVLKGATLVK